VRIGIDSYSYHRLLGEVRPGERAPDGAIADPVALVGEMAATGAEVLSLETVFLDAPARVDAAALRAAAAGRELAIAWGHPLGLRWGTDAAALFELLAWIDVAPALGARIVRCVAAGPALRDLVDLEATTHALRFAAARARARGVTLALENHGDVDQPQLLELLEAIPELAVCLDTANAVRVGDDPVTLTRAVSHRIAIVHLKDVEEPRRAGADPLTGPASVPYGEGIVDLYGVLAALPDDPDLPVCIELGHLGSGDVDERALVGQGVRWLAATVGS
jgi:sugar phosphate isomerase/epimerase